MYGPASCQEQVQVDHPDFSGEKASMERVAPYGKARVRNNETDVHPGLINTCSIDNHSVRNLCSLVLSPTVNIKNHYVNRCQRLITTIHHTIHHHYL